MINTEHCGATGVRLKRPSGSIMAVFLDGPSAIGGPPFLYPLITYAVVSLAKLGGGRRVLLQRRAAIRPAHPARFIRAGNPSAGGVLDIVSDAFVIRHWTDEA
jgi:hypothetical protein